MADLAECPLYLFRTVCYDYSVQNAQVVRGVGMNIGTHTGILDFKGMAKIATGQSSPHLPSPLTPSRSSFRNAD